VTTTTAPPRRDQARKPRPPIDPRIRERRIAVRKDEGRKRLRRVAFALCWIGVVSGLWAITLSPLLDIDAIRIEGATRTGEPAVLAALDIRRGDALLTADVGGAARALASLPWVATADVRRSWPGALEVRIVEREPVAAIAARGGGWVVVDLGGRQLAVEAEPAVSLTRIAGRSLEPALGEGAGERYRGAIDVAAALPASLRGTVASLWPQPDGGIEAAVTGHDVVVRFGPADQLEAKLVALAAILERIDLATVGVIDLRVPGAPALTNR
jgi:cell division protein FtsQ